MTTTQRNRLQARIDQATARAFDMARQGARPVLVGRDDSADGCQTYQVWEVGSRSRPGATHRVELLADLGALVTDCDCEAGAHGVPCWHRAAVRLAALGHLPAAPVAGRFPERTCRECGGAFRGTVDDGRPVDVTRCADCARRGVAA